MKSYCLITLAACLVLSACNKENENPHSIELTWTECASTKAGGTKGGTSADTPAQLILEYTESGLAVTLKNVQSDGEMTYGRAIGTDVVEGSVEATMSAINKDFARMKPTRRS